MWVGVCTIVACTHVETGTRRYSDTATQRHGDTDTDRQMTWTQIREVHLGMLNRPEFAPR